MCRDARGTRWLDELTQDIRYTFRTLRQRPTLTAVVVLTLALGGGATTIMFAVINAVLLKPFSYPDPGRLVTLVEQTSFSTQYGNQWAFAYPNYLDLKQEVHALTLGAWRPRRGTVSAPGEPEYVNGREISPELLPVLGISIAQGRNFQETEDRPGAAAVAIISHALWQRHHFPTNSRHQSKSLRLPRPNRFLRIRGTEFHHRRFARAPAHLTLRPLASIKLKCQVRYAPALSL